MRHEAAGVARRRGAVPIACSGRNIRVTRGSGAILIPRTARAARVTRKGSAVLITGRYRAPVVTRVDRGVVMSRRRVVVGIAGHGLVLITMGSGSVLVIRPFVLSV
jgi:hypothetical protein